MNKKGGKKSGVFVPLIDLDSSVGFTQFWPGSHAHPELAGFGPAAPMLGLFYPYTRSLLFLYILTSQASGGLGFRA
jgi:hypothetical protein